MLAPDGTRHDPTVGDVAINPDAWNGAAVRGATDVAGARGVGQRFGAHITRLGRTAVRVVGASTASDIAPTLG